MMKIDYRKLWTNSHGHIPCDAQGRTFEIHHIDGDHSNNSIDNLACISIQEHYETHKNQGDWGACLCIAKRLSFSPEELRNIQLGKKRPGIGGAPKGRIPWNKGKPGYTLSMSSDGKQRKLLAVKRSAKIQDSTADEIRSKYHTQALAFQNVGETMPNGRVLTYRRAFIKHFAGIFEVTPAYIDRILHGKVKCSNQTQSF